MTPTPELLDCREAFEAYLKKRHISAQLGKDAWGRECYEFAHVQTGWEAWQAAWSARPAAGQSEECLRTGAGYSTGPHDQHGLPAPPQNPLAALREVVEGMKRWEDGYSSANARGHNTALDAVKAEIDKMMGRK